MRRAIVPATHTSLVLARGFPCSADLSGRTACLGYPRDDQRSANQSDDTGLPHRLRRRWISVLAAHRPAWDGHIPVGCVLLPSQRAKSRAKRGRARRRSGARRGTAARLPPIGGAGVHRRAASSGGHGVRHRSLRVHRLRRTARRDKAAVEGLCCEALRVSPSLIHGRWAPPRCYALPKALHAVQSRPLPLVRDGRDTPREEWAALLPKLLRGALLPGVAARADRDTCARGL
eukprot:scaffold74968_cov37-Phaeocystis_antarctica.AAC.2